MMFQVTVDKMMMMSVDERSYWIFCYCCLHRAAVCPRSWHDVPGDMTFGQFFSSATFMLCFCIFCITINSVVFFADQADDV